jgi:hypothetical protein
MDPPWHCGKVMVPDYAVGLRTCWACRNQCGHRSYTGMIGTLKPSAQPLLPRQKLCDFCHTPLPPRSHHQTKYHRNCREVIKWQAAKLYKSRMQQDGTP